MNSNPDMVRIQDIVSVLETKAPPGLQESYDNAGLLTGSPEQEVTGVLVCLDVLPAVLEEAAARGCNCIVSHHPPFFSGMKRFSGASLQEQVLIGAIRRDIAIYACHTNLDSLPDGVSGVLADSLGLVRTSILAPRDEDLIKLVCFVPATHLQPVSLAVYDAGAGMIGQYDHCSFQVAGNGTFKAKEGTNPFVGIKGVDHTEPEIRFETIVPRHLLTRVIKAMLTSHPYDEVAYDLYPLVNANPSLGSGIIGDLGEACTEQEFLHRAKDILGIPVIRHSRLRGNPVRRVAVCGGSGMAFLPHATRQGADVYLTSDIKYHQWSDVPPGIILADAGHYESERFAIGLLADILIEKFPTFAVYLTEVNTNPIYYLI